MAEVYLAEDTELGRRVALKLLPDDSTSDEQARRRLLREARAVAALDHPHICSVYDVGEDAGRRFIAMQFVDGDTLDLRLKRQRYDVKEVLSIAVDVADALADAHERGIVHRDIKPSNVMITPRSGAVVLDFGLAKDGAEREAADAVTESVLSAPGVPMGTVPYMSPEQVRADHVDGRSDIFSFGVMLYEMLTGQRPFADKTSAAIAAAILTREPAPLTAVAPETPAELVRIVTKMLRKEPAERYQTAKDLLVDLRALVMPTSTGVQSGPLVVQPASRSRRGSLVVAVAVVIAVAAGWYFWRQARIRHADGQIVRVETLEKEGSYFDAFDLAVQAAAVLPQDSRLARLMPAVSMALSVKTEPAGAAVFLKRFKPDASGTMPPRQQVGVTPLDNLRIARGEYVLSIEKDGFAPVERTVSGTIIRSGTLAISPPPLSLNLRLIPEKEMPSRMVAVPGGDYRLVGWSRPTDRRVQLDGYFIDKYEVTNQEFKEFINAGGYLKRDFWTEPLVKDGRVLSWDDAMKVMTDRSGLAGPRGWSNQNFPEGKADHPVTGITWYEASAYAAFRGKTLPTVFQWEKAARDGAVLGPAAFMPWGVFYPGSMLAHHANFDNNGTVPATALEFGMSPFGAFNMAGNVAEWTANDTSEGRVATGAAWGDPTYVFGQYAFLPGFYSSDKLGFRCAVTAPGTNPDQARARIELTKEIPKYTPSSAADFAKWRKAYDYDATQALAARVEEVQETPEWRREKITYTGAHGERAIAYLYLPQNFSRPLQVINFVPAADVDAGFRPLTASMEDRLSLFIKSGRAAFGVVLSGYIGRLRASGAERPDRHTVEYAEELVGRVTDLRRGLDYLATRTDVDSGRIAFFGPSAGAQLGLILAAVETRYRAVALLGAGLPMQVRKTIDEAFAANFAGHIKPPKLMLHGKYDEDTPIRTAGMPLYELLPQPKRLVMYEGGHVAPVDLQFSILGPWFDEIMGPVRR